MSDSEPRPSGSVLSPASLSPAHKQFEAATHGRVGVPPVIPRPAMPQPPAAAGMLKPLAQNNLLLAILGVLAAVVGGPIVFLLMRH